MHKMALNSLGKLAIIPMQDIVGLEGEEIMIIPESIKRNWTWRINYEEIPILQADELKAFKELYGRTDNSSEDIIP